MSGRLRRRASATSSSRRGLLGEAGDFEVRAMHAEQEARAVVDGALVVGDARAVGGADFAQRGLRLRHHVGNAERAADFDQFAAGDDDFAAFGQRVQGEQNGGGVVVDDDGRERCAGASLGWQPGPAHMIVEIASGTGGHVDVAFSAFAGCQIEFEIGIGAPRSRGCDRGRRWRAARVRDWCGGSRRWR